MWQEGWEPGIGGSLSHPLWPDCTICTICTICQFLPTAESQAICFQGVKADKDQQNVMLWHTDAHVSVVWYSKVVVVSTWDQKCHTANHYCCIVATIWRTRRVHRGRLRFILMELGADEISTGVMWQVWVIPIPCRKTLWNSPSSTLMTTSSGALGLWSSTHLGALIARGGAREFANQRRSPECLVSPEPVAGNHWTVWRSGKAFHSFHSFHSFRANSHTSLNCGWVDVSDLYHSVSEASWPLAGWLPYGRNLQIKLFAAQWSLLCLKVCDGHLGAGGRNESFWSLVKMQRVSLCPQYLHRLKKMIYAGGVFSDMR